MAKKSKQKAEKNRGNLTQEELAARQEQKRLRREASILENLEARYTAAREKIQELGLSIKHIRPEVETEDGFYQMANGGVTVAFRQKSSNTFIELATALCSTKDSFSRKAGTVVAVENFVAGQAIRFPNYARVTPGALVDELFRTPLTYTLVEEDTLDDEDIAYHAQSLCDQGNIAVFKVKAADICPLETTS